MNLCFLLCFLLFVCRSSVTSEEEPMCTKFMYDKQMIETMVRMEVKMDQWDKDRKAVEEHHKEELDQVVRAQNVKLESLIADLNDIRSDVRNMKSDMDKEAVHGGWSDWENWGTCSATCGIGMQNRLRSCTDPAPDRFGNHCFGHGFEYTLCNQRNCEETMKNTTKVAFNAYTTISGSNKVLIFPNALLNEGGGYNNNTGKFTAPISGLYHFNAHVCSNGGRFLVVSIVQETTVLATSTEFAYGYSSCSTVSAPALMTVGENVFVQSVESFHINLFADASHRWPSFSGFLVNE